MKDLNNNNRSIILIIILIFNTNIIFGQYEVSDDILKLEKKVFQLVNQHRVERNLEPIVLDTTITLAARQHSQDMAYKRIPFGHDGFKGRAHEISRILVVYIVAENVADLLGCSDCAQRALNGWLNSPSHRMTIEGNYRLTGVGVAGNRQFGYYFTQMFIQ